MWPGDGWDLDSELEYAAPVRRVFWRHEKDLRSHRVVIELDQILEMDERNAKGRCRRTQPILELPIKTATTHRLMYCARFTKLSVPCHSGVITYPAFTCVCVVHRVRVRVCVHACMYARARACVCAGGRACLRARACVFRSRGGCLRAGVLYASVPHAGACAQRCVCTCVCTCTCACICTCACMSAFGSGECVLCARARLVLVFTMPWPPTHRALISLHTHLCHCRRDRRKSLLSNKIPRNRNSCTSPNFVCIIRTAGAVLLRAPQTRRREQEQIGNTRRVTGTVPLRHQHVSGTQRPWEGTAVRPLIMLPILVLTATSPRRLRGHLVVTIGIHRRCCQLSACGAWLSA